MCGRTALSLNEDQVRCACSFKPKGSSTFVKPEWLPEHNDGKQYTPSHNITPSEVTPVIVSSNKFKNVAKHDRVIKPMMWGIVPPWHKGNYKSHNLSTNNCRLENINGSKLYSPILKDGGRCIIPVEGFYEWQTTNKSCKGKQPYYIYAPQDKDIKVDEPKSWNMEYNEENGWSGIRLLLMAGLYSIWENEGTIIYSYSVITMDSNATLDWLHHRMPAVLDDEEQIQAWLDIENVDPQMALSYLKPVKMLSWHPVSSDVNNSRNKSDRCNKRVTIESKPTQKTLNNWFVKSEKRKSSDDCSSEAKKMKN